MTKEINCLTHIPGRGFSLDTRYPRRVLTGIKAHPRRPETDPQVLIETYLSVDLKGVIEGEEGFEKSGFSYMRWINPYGGVEHWHLILNSKLDDTTHHFLNSVRKKLPPHLAEQYVLSAKSKLPSLEIRSGEGSIYDLKNGGRIFTKSGANNIFWKDSMGCGELDFVGDGSPGGIIQVGISSEGFVPTALTSTETGAMQVCAALQLSPMSMCDMEEALHEIMQAREPSERAMREIINPQLYIEAA